MKRLAAIAVLFAFLLGCVSVSPEEASKSTAAQTAVTDTIAISVSTTISATFPLETTEALPQPEEFLLASMTLEEKIGQLFLARCPDMNAVKDISRYALGGYILFSRDFMDSDPQLISQTIAGYQAAAKIPMLIAVDEEGGSVCRVSCYPAFREKRFSSPKKLFSKGGMEAVLREEKEKCQLLQSIGINVNMAPVCDIATDRNAFMYARSLGQNPETTARFVSETVSVMESYGIGSVLKHFPGYGNNADTHSGIAVDVRTLEELEEFDLIPFAAGIETGCDAILVSHTIVNAIDAKLPACLSPAVLAYLRKELGFTGVVITDDLDMRAITKQFGTEEAAVLAVLAGCDLLCTGSYAKQYQAILDAVSSGRITIDRIDDSVLKILRWKIELGLISTDFS